MRLQSRALAVAVAVALLATSLHAATSPEQVSDVISVDAGAARTPARKATPKPTIGSTSKALARTSKVKVCSPHNSATKLKVATRTSSKAKWKTRTTRTLKARACVSIPVSTLASKPQRTHVRFQLTAQGRKTATVTRTIKVAATTPKITFTQRPTTLASTTKSALKGTVTSPAGQSLHIQERIGGKWKTVARATLPKSGRAKFTYTLSPTSKTRTFRVYLPATTWTRKVVTSAVTVKRPAPAPAHSSYLARASSYMRPWCPGVPISLDTKAVKTGNTVGMARTLLSWQGDWFSWKQSIELRSGLNEATLKHTALHECAHIVQFRLYTEGLGAYEEFMDANERTFGRPTDERLADCMAALKTGDPSRMGYMNAPCTPEQNRVAAQLWRDYGTKFQSADFEMRGWRE